MILINVINKIENKLIDVLCKKVRYVKFRKQHFSFKILHILWYVIFNIPRFLIWFLTKRFICLVTGCNIMETQGGYVAECLRCEAWDEFGETSEYKLIKRR